MTSKNAFVLFLIIRNVRLDNIALYSVEDVAIHSSQYLLYLPRIWLADTFEVLHLNLFLAILFYTVYFWRPYFSAINSIEYPHPAPITVHYISCKQAS